MVSNKDQAKRYVKAFKRLSERRDTITDNLLRLYRELPRTPAPEGTAASPETPTFSTEAATAPSASAPYTPPPEHKDWLHRKLDESPYTSWLNTPLRRETAYGIKAKAGEKLAATKQAIASAHQNWNDLPLEERIVKQKIGVAVTTMAGMATCAYLAEGLMTIPLYLLAAWIGGLGVKNNQELKKAQENPDHTVDLDADHHRRGYCAAAAVGGLAAATQMVPGHADTSSVLEGVGYLAGLGTLGAGLAIAHHALPNHEPTVRAQLPATMRKGILCHRNKLLKEGHPQLVVDRVLQYRLEDGEEREGLIGRMIDALDEKTSNGIIIPATRKYLADTARTVSDTARTGMTTIGDIVLGVREEAHSSGKAFGLRTGASLAALAGLEILTHTNLISGNDLIDSAYHLVYGGSVAGIGFLNARHYQHLGQRERLDIETAVRNGKLPRHWHRPPAPPRFAYLALAGLILAGSVVAIGSTVKTDIFDQDQQTHIEETNGRSHYGDMVLPSVLPWPVESPDERYEQKITSRYGPRRGGPTVSSYHQGVDIVSASKRDYAVAMLDGVVTNVNPCRGMVKLHHGTLRGEPVTSLYLHLYHVTAAPGQHVKAGDYLGVTGAREVFEGIHDDGTCGKGKLLFRSKNGLVAPHTHVELRVGTDEYISDPTSPVRLNQVLFGTPQDEGRVNLECFFGELGVDYNLTGGALSRIQDRPRLEQYCRNVRRVLGVSE